MVGKYYPRGFAERPPDHKRALPLPFTFTTIITLTSSTTSDTQTVTTSSTTSSTTTSTTSSSQTTQSTTDTSSDSDTSTQASTQTSAIFTTSPSDIPTDTPIASAISSFPSVVPSNMADSSVSGTRKIPAGAIVGIVIGCLIVILVGLLIFLRSRFRRRRQQRRTWMQTSGVPSQAVTGFTASSFAPAERYSEPARDLSSGMYFAQPEAQAFRPPPLPTAIVKFSFVPDLSDELEIVNGETLTIMQEFDDGWALCSNSRGIQGMVPLECLDRRMTVQYGVGVREVRGSRRASSLLGAQFPTR